MTTFKSHEGHVLIFESKSLFHPSNTHLGVLEHSLPANDQMLMVFSPSGNMMELSLPYMKSHDPIKRS